MGLWVTGYAEFAYDRPGSDNNWTDKYPPKLGPVPFPCPTCGRTFATLDEVMRHRFESHPLKRPVLFLRGSEASSTRVVISSSLAAAEVHCSSTISATLNGKPVELAELPASLAGYRSGLKEIVLCNGDNASRYELLFDIADEKQITAVDEAFMRLVRPDELSVERVELLVREAREFETVGRYVEGLAQYLYGVMAKDRRGGTHIQFEHYRERFNLAASALAGFATPLAEATLGVISFSLNVFDGSSLLRHSPRLAYIMKWFGDITGRVATRATIHKEGPSHGVVEIPLDAVTETILRWTEEMIENGCLEEANYVCKCVADGAWAADDRFKATVLLAEHLRQAGRLMEARNLARAYAEDALFGRWAASFPAE